MNAEVPRRSHRSAAAGRGASARLAGVAADRVVAIVGGGPSGCALAIRLAQRGVPVAVFEGARRPPLTIGESLVPAAMPHLRSLGIEERVRAMNVSKPGALLVHGSGERADFRFRTLGRRAPDYACNVARPRFDDTLAERARQLGVHFVARRAGLLACEPRDGTCRDGQPRELTLDAAALAALDLAPGRDGSRHPGLLVDASGRSRVFARRLGLSAARGARDDIACFAHFSGMRHDDAAPGQIVISVLERGWSWRIPVQDAAHGGDRVSVGVVLPRSCLEDRQGEEQGGDRAGGKHRCDAESLLAQAMREEPLLAAVSADARRCSRALRYEHYQLIGERAHGPGWAATGDAFGFVDPMLSPGVFMALESAMLLNDRVRITRDGVPQLQDAAGYERTLRGWFAGWNHVIETFYDGRMLALQRAARARGERVHGLDACVHALAERCMRRAIAELVSGAGTRSRIAQQVFARGAAHLLRDAVEADAPARFAVRDTVDLDG